jgi:hypothetical protein
VISVVFHPRIVSGENNKLLKTVISLYFQTFCEAVNSSNRPSNSELAAAVKKCSDIHVTLTKEAAMGNIHSH